MQIRVLGPVGVTGADRIAPIPLQERRLLAALVTQRGLVCPAEKLISTLWPAARPRAAAKVLQVYVSRLRRRIPRGARITYRSDGYILEIHPEMLDALEFEQLVQEGRRAAEAGDAEGSRTQLKRALSLWSGQAYGEFADEDFARLDAAHLEELRLEAFEQQVNVELDLSAHAELLPELIALAAAHPLRERLQGQLILALYRSGRQAEALETYATMRMRLQDDLGLEPGPELRALQRRILSHDPDLGAAPRALSMTRRLPLPAAPLLGRVRERRELCALLSHDDVRLLVLTGPAGAGKTRLALAVAGEVAQRFSGGAALVDLTPIHDPGLVMDAIADALGVVGRSTCDIVSRLNERELLLLIDNAEHVRAAGPTLVGLLAHVPSLRILVTSRVVLHVSGEHVYPVGPLDEQTAVELFQARARARNPRFELSTANDADTIARICERLDRLPLAIELAATRTRALSPRQLLARLDPSLPLLANGLRDLPARQQTLRAALDWSHDLLADADRAALMRLSVFVGGWTLDAAETVATATTDALEALVDHNFVSTMSVRPSRDTPSC